MNELEEQLRGVLDEFVEEVTGLAKEDFKRFGKEMTEDFASFLYRAYAKGEEDAKKDLRHLKAQTKLLAIKHRIHITREGMEKLVKAMEILARLGLALLKVNLPLP
jgi:hypothetical protein